MDQLIEKQKGNQRKDIAGRYFRNLFVQNMLFVVCSVRVEAWIVVLCL